MNCALAGAQMHHGRPLNRVVMQHKDAPGQRWAALIIAAVVALNLYWLVSLFMRPTDVRAEFVVAGLTLQVAGIVGTFGKLPRIAQKSVPGILFMIAVLFGAGMEWFGLFHGHATGRVAPSIWAPAQ
jgi:hypothetical protein